MISSKKELTELNEKEQGHNQTYSERIFAQSVPKYIMPDAGMPADAAYELVHDETAMDCNPQLNLSSFVTTWMEPEADKLIAENIHKNFIDLVIYWLNQEFCQYLLIILLWIQESIHGKTYTNI